MKNKNQNIKFVYLYRDASNYKQWGHVTFPNPEGVDPDNLDRRLRAAMMVDSTFMAGQVRVPEVFLFNTMGINEDDHCLHEYDSLEIVQERANDKQGRSILEFVGEVERAALRGWEGFVPAIALTTVERFKLLL
jgi:hypothetical protein